MKMSDEPGTNLVIVKEEPEVFIVEDDDDHEYEYPDQDGNGTGSDSQSDSQSEPVVRRTVQIVLKNGRRDKTGKMRTYRKKRVSELTPEEQEKRRARWKEESRRKRERQKYGNEIGLDSYGSDDNCQSEDFPVVEKRTARIELKRNYKASSEGEGKKSTSRKKRVSELTPEEQEKRRAKWKEDSRRKRERQRQKNGNGSYGRDDAFSEDSAKRTVGLNKGNVEAVSEGGGKKSPYRKKRVSELTPEEQEKRREKWKEEARRKRERQRQKLLELGEGVETVKKPYKKKKVSEMTPEELQIMREKWRKQKEGKVRKNYERKRVPKEGKEYKKKPTSDESRERRNKRRREYYQKMAKLGLKRKKLADLPPDERERRRLYNRERHERLKEMGRTKSKWGVSEKALAELTPEELEQRREEWLQKQRIYQCMRKANMTEEQLKEQKMRMYINYLTRKAHMTPEQLEKIRERKRELKRMARERTMTPEEREQYRERLRVRREKMRLRREGLLPPKKKGRRVAKPKVKKEVVRREPILKTAAFTEEMTPEQRERERIALRNRINCAKFKLRRRLLAQGASEEVIALEVQRLIEKYYNPPQPEPETLTPEEKRRRERNLFRSRVCMAKKKVKTRLLAEGASEEVIAAEMQRVEDKYAALAPQLTFSPRYRHIREAQPSTGPSSPEISQKTEVVSEEPEPIPVNHDPQFQVASYHPIQDYQPESSEASYYHSFDDAPSHESPPPSPDPQPDPWNPPVSTPASDTSNVKRRGRPKKICVVPPPVPRVSEASYFHSFDDAPVHQSPPPSPDPEPEPEWNPPVSTPAPATSHTSTMKGPPVHREPCSEWNPPVPPAPATSDSSNVNRPKRGRPRKGEIRIVPPPPPRQRVSYRTNPESFREICDECGKPFTSQKYLDKHKVMVHTGDFKDGRCTTCGEQFETASRFYLHWFKTHRTRTKGKRRPRKVAEAEFICEDCGTSFSMEANMRRHKYYEHGSGNLPENWNTCHLCPKSFKHKETLNIHLTVAHGLVRYRCNHCPQTFDKLYTLNNHVTQEHPDKVWVCKFCGVLRNTEIARDFHISTGDCKKVSKEEYVKWKMENVGFERERLKCEFCEMVVDCKNLVDHYKHTHGVKEDRWECMCCSKVSANRHYIGVHMIDMHGMDAKEVLEKIRYLNVKDRSKVKVMNLKGRYRGLKIEKGEIEEDEEDEEEEEEGAIKLRKSRRKYPIKDGGGEAGEGQVKKKKKYKRRKRNKVVKEEEAEVGGEEGEDDEEGDPNMPEVDGHVKKKKKYKKRRRNKVAKEEEVEVGSEEGEDDEESEEVDPNMPEVERLKRKYGKTQSKTRGRKKKGEEEESDDDYVPKEVKSRSSRYQTRGIRKTYKEDDEDDEEEDEVEVRTRRTTFQSDPKLNMNPVVMLMKCDKLLLAKTEV